MLFASLSVVLIGQENKDFSTLLINCTMQVTAKLTANECTSELPIDKGQNNVLT